MKKEALNIQGFDEYIRQGEPEKKEKASIWQTAIGLQAVDGLKTSDYLKETARKHIEGDIDIDQVRELIDVYLKVCLNMLERFATITSPKRNGCSKAIP